MTPRNLTRAPGFTLIELVIVVAVVAILLSIAIPSYLDSVVRSRRSDAMTTLTRYANQQEIFYSNTNSYSTNLGLSSSSSEGYYVISTPAASATAYTVQATPVNGSSQSGDGSFRITSTGQKLWDMNDDGTYSFEWGDR